MKKRLIDIDRRSFRNLYNLIYRVLITDNFTGNTVGQISPCAYALDDYQLKQE